MILFEAIFNNYVSVFVGVHLFFFVAVVYMYSASIDIYGIAVLIMNVDTVTKAYMNVVAVF